MLHLRREGRPLGGFGVYISWTTNRVPNTRVSAGDAPAEFVAIKIIRPTMGIFDKTCTNMRMWKEMVTLRNATIWGWFWGYSAPVRIGQYAIFLNSRIVYCTPAALGALDGATNSESWEGSLGKTAWKHRGKYLDVPLIHKIASCLQCEWSQVKEPVTQGPTRKARSEREHTNPPHSAHFGDVHSFYQVLTYAWWLFSASTLTQPARTHPHSHTHIHIYNMGIRDSYHLFRQAIFFLAKSTLKDQRGIPHKSTDVLARMGP